MQSARNIGAGHIDDRLGIRIYIVLVDARLLRLSVRFVWDKRRLRMTTKELIRMLTPPLFIRLAKFLRAGSNCPIEWEYVPEGFAYSQTHPEVKGWNVSDVLATYKEKWPRFVSMVQGTEPLGVTHESELTTSMDIIGHNTIMSFAYALTLAARHKDRLFVLDWGGGIGHYYLLAKALLPGVEIEYHCKDVPILCEHGAQLFPQQYFYTDMSCFKRRFDLVLASCSLHYTEDWRTLLQRLAGATGDYLYVANLPTVQQCSSFVFIQRPYRYGYNTEYLAWCLNRMEFLDAAERSGLDLLREFVYGHQPLIKSAPEQNVYRGFLFRSRQQGKQ